MQKLFKYIAILAIMVLPQFISLPEVHASYYDGDIMWMRPPSRGCPYGGCPMAITHATVFTDKDVYAPGETISVHAFTIENFGMDYGIGLSSVEGGWSCNATHLCGGDFTMTAPLVEGVYPLNFAGCWISSDMCGTFSLSVLIANPASVNLNFIKKVDPTTVDASTKSTIEPDSVEYIVSPTSGAKAKRKSQDKVELEDRN
jgi:hypothetical protein